METDYIIVGLGLAGLAFSNELDKHHKSYVVFENDSQNSSLVAGGMYNPVVLKRFTPVWNAESQLKIALPFYKNLEEKFNKKYDYKVDIYRIFKSVEEQNNWFIACDNPVLSKYMCPTIQHKKVPGITSDFGFGKLTNTGRIDTHELLKDYRKSLTEKGLLIMEDFNHNQLKLTENNIIYKNIKAKHILFCEGFGIKDNPFLNYLPMQEAKGELITIYVPQLNIDFLIKAAVFVLPLGNHYYKVGATFNWKDKTQLPTSQGKSELISKLNTFISVPYEIIEHSAGIRPTVKDRRPLVGQHPKFKQMSVLNGLGTRGVMIAPAMAKALYNHIENNEVLDAEISIHRFE